jgi:uncharacterized protein Usg
MSHKLQGLESVVRMPDWRLTTAELFYHLPDHPHVLQSFIWQKLDRAPDFPELDRFLAFWQREIDGPLHSVRVASAALTLCEWGVYAALKPLDTGWRLKRGQKDHAPHPATGACRA